MPYVSTFRAPSEYELEMERARRQQALAEALAQQAYQPLEGGAAPIPSAAPLVRALQSFMAGRAERKATEAAERAEKAGRKELTDYIKSFEPEQRTVGMGEIAAMEATAPQIDAQGRVSYNPPSAVAAPNQQLRPAMTASGEVDLSQPMQMQVGGPLSMAQRRARALEGFESTNPLVQQIAQAQYAASTPQRQELKVGDIDPSKFTAQSIAEAQRTGDIGKLQMIPAKKPAAPTELSRLMAERDALPPGDPQRATYEAAIRKASTSAPSTVVNLDTKGSQLGQELYLKKIDALSTPATNANRIINQVGAMEEATKKGTFTGAMAPNAIGAAQFLSSFGIDVKPDVLANSRTFQAASNQLVLDFMASNGGARGFTEKETAILQDAFPKIVDSPQARQQIASLLRNRAKKDVEDYNRAVETYRKTYPNSLIPYNPIEDADSRYEQWKRSQGIR